MSLKCGIVGLPNVGKSTLFNALTSSIQAQAANYPFCTIEPNVGIVNVPDERLYKLASIASSAKILPATVELVDIAGLVKGASKGEGLGNKFLNHIREVGAIILVLRCFEDDDITHVNGVINPVVDAEIIELELILSDLEIVDRKITTVDKKSKANAKEAAEIKEFLTKLLNHLSQNKTARTCPDFEVNKHFISDLNLLTAKPMMYVGNVAEEDSTTGNHHSKALEVYAKSQNSECLIISAKIEAEISLLNDEEKKEFMDALGLEETGLNKIIKAGYKLLDLNSYFTIGPKEARAWTFKSGTLAPAAAGIIHTDFEKGFIRAEVIDYKDYISIGSEAKIKELGKMRLEGKEYTVKDGDVIHFRFNV